MSSVLTDPAIRKALNAARPTVTGRVVRVVGLTFEIEGLPAAIGDMVRLGDHPGVLGEIVALGEHGPIGMPLGELRGMQIGTPARIDAAAPGVPVGFELLGRVLDGMGVPLDDGPSLDALAHVDVDAEPPHPLRRALVRQPQHLGVRALDTLVPCGRGQRIGIMAGSGVGKSSLLSMIIRGTEADVSVLALIGERGREVREFIEHDLGPEGLQRAVVVVATSDQPALVRKRAAFVATRIAEWFRDQGKNVNLMMDSLTRFAMAQREIGLAAGEVPATRGYPPSMFGLLPKLLERAGAAEHGSITGLYTVLVEGDDMNDPVGDTARSILDGHVTLSRSLASQGHFPTIEVLDSVSRVAGAVTDDHQQSLMRELRALLAAYREARDLIEIGAYKPGANPTVDRAVALHDQINAFLRQSMNETDAPGVAWQRLRDLLATPNVADHTGGGTVPVGMQLPVPGQIPMAQAMAAQTATSAGMLP
ncbi:MAG TPA: FliI/YscN family ATPase [Microthrixaceae bacterium]|nr:FliI/YscN family ATPase [Microthrixaceae bacterium]HPB44761.1 FliI/YscN family ATPase [Microthrixaceae bacterium]